MTAKRRGAQQIDLDGIDGMSLSELRGLWRERWGERPPGYRSREFFKRAIAYREQAELHGALPPRLGRELDRLAAAFMADRGFTPVPRPTLKPGSSLVREWGGVRHEVAVTEEGFVYRGQRFGSLSQAAGHITGVKWNGHVFFGLKARAKAA